MIKQSLVGLLFLTTSSLFGQNFEGWVTYKVEVENPYPEFMPDSIWQESLKMQLGERGYMLQKYFYKNNNYISEIDAGRQNGFQAFNPEDGLLYSWQENSDTAITLNSKKFIDVFKKIIHSEETDTLLGIPCKSIIVTSSLGKMILWYNNSYFKMDAKYYKGHIYGHWEQILKEIGCLPLKIEQEGKQTQTIIEFKEEPLSEDKFKIPFFKKILINPVN